MSYDHGYALLIGIDDYSTFDHENGRKKGTSDLRGSVYDARVLFRVCVALGMKPENIRILASPRPDFERHPDLASVRFDDATDKDIRDALGWLRDKLADGSPGLLAYSGHGAHQSGKGLLLCPSDTGEDFRNAISFKEVGELLGDSTRNLTVVLGCCHGVAPKSAVAGERHRPASTLGGAQIHAAHLGECEASLNGMGARVLAACKPGELTQQASIAGRWRSAFVWAISAVADQWTGVNDAATKTGRLDLTYDTLLDKTRHLLTTLEFAGTPALYGRPGVGELSVFQVGNRPESTSASPNAGRERIQLDGGMNNTNRLYTLTAHSSAGDTVIAKIFATNSSYSWTNTVTRQVFGPVTEYYFCLANLPTGVTSITVTAADSQTSPPTGAYIYEWAEGATFSSMTPASDASTFVYTNTPGFALKWTVAWNGTTWGGTIIWYGTGTGKLFTGAASNVNYMAYNNTSSTGISHGCSAAF